MKEEQGFFVRYSDAFYSQPFGSLKEARADARSKAPGEKLQIYHGVLKRVNDQVIDDSQLYLVPRVAGYGKN